MRMQMRRHTTRPQAPTPPRKIYNLLYGLLADHSSANRLRESVTYSQRLETPIAVWTVSANRRRSIRIISTVQRKTYRGLRCRAGISSKMMMLRAKATNRKAECMDAVDELAIVSRI